jgi:hypothetical protein
MHLFTLEKYRTVNVDHDCFEDFITRKRLDVA